MNSNMVKPGQNGMSSVADVSHSLRGHSRQTNKCWKLTIEILEKDVVCLKLTIKTPERRHWYRSDVFFVTLKYITPVFLFPTLNK